MSDITTYEENVHAYFDSLPNEAFHNPGCLICNTPAVEPDEFLFKKRSMVVRHCESCGLIYNARQPRSGYLTAFYTQSDAMADWAKIKDTLMEERRQREKFSKVLDWYWNLNIYKAIDYGCGNGKFLTYLKRRTPEGKYWGVEVNENARQYAQRAGHDVFNGWPSSCSVDAISFFGVVEHLPDPISELKKAKKYLKKDGYVAVIVPNVSSQIVSKAGSRCFTYCPQHLWYFNHSTLNHLYEKAGYQEVQWWTIEPEALPVIRVGHGLDPYNDSKDPDIDPKEVGEMDEQILSRDEGYKIVSIAKRVE